MEMLNIENCTMHMGTTSIWLRQMGFSREARGKTDPSFCQGLSLLEVNGMVQFGQAITLQTGIT
jgi:hypothetical protein